MTGLYGWFGREAHPARAALQAGLNASDGTSRVTTASASSGLIKVENGWAQAGGNAVLAGVVGRPAWRDPELAALAETRGHAAAAVEAYRRHGEALPAQLRGAFGVAVIDSEKHRMMLINDRFARHPLYFAVRDNGVMFGSTASGVAACCGLQRDISPRGLYAYLYFHMVPSPISVFDGVEKLQAAHCLVADGHSSKANTYWTPGFEEQSSASQEALAEELHERLVTAVDRSRDASATGAFLSGGLDSSSVAGVLSRQSARSVPTFSIGFDAPGYDEIAYARIAVEHFGTDAHEYYVTPDDVLDSVPVIAAGYDEPFGNSSALPAYFCAQSAVNAGISRLLGGDGGDEIFAGNARYAKQRVFSHWTSLPSPLRSGLGPLLTSLPGSVPLLRKARSYVEQAQVPLPARLQSYNFLHRIPPAEMLHGDFLAAVDTRWPLQWMEAIYHRPVKAGQLNRMMYLDWQLTLADNDLRKVSRMCELAGVDVSFPMLDDDLVEFSCRVPSELKLRNGRLRSFYRDAMRGFLPDAILDKSKHGFGLPFGLWMREDRRLQDLAYDSLRDLGDRGVVRRDFIDRLIALHRDGHAPYYGELVWVLMMLEQWWAACDRGDIGRPAAPAVSPRGCRNPAADSRPASR